MTQSSYSYYRVLKDRYLFVSSGKKQIQKVVQFESTSRDHVINIGFGDLLEDGSINDTIHSNNGNMVKVLATVIQILKDYTNRHPHIEILFTGSTPERTRLYGRILRTYYNEFSKNFEISAIKNSDNTMKRIAYDPNADTEYFAFLIKRISQLYIHANRKKKGLQKGPPFSKGFYAHSTAKKALDGPCSVIPRKVSEGQRNTQQDHKSIALLPPAPTTKAVSSAHP